MVYRKKKKLSDPQKKNRRFSIRTKLKEEGMINSDFEMMVQNLHLEDIIALKLEMTAAQIDNHLYGINIYNSIDKLAKNACLKYAVSATRTQLDASEFLGLQLESFKEILRESGITYHKLIKENIYGTPKMEE